MEMRIVLGLSLLAGAASASADWVTCNPGVCTFNVTVQSAADGSCSSVDIDNPQAVVEKGQTPVLRWVVTGGEFAQNGIDFDKPADPPDFKMKSRDPTEIQFVDAHRDTGDFHYTIYVQGCPALDPYIRNK